MKNQKLPYDQMLRRDEHIAKLRHDYPGSDIKDIGIGEHLMKRTAHIIGGFKQSLVNQVIAALEKQGGGALIFDIGDIDGPLRVYAKMNGHKFDIGMREDFVEFMGEDVVAKIDELAGVKE